MDERDIFRIVADPSILENAAENQKCADWATRYLNWLVDQPIDEVEEDIREDVKALKRYRAALLGM